MAKLEFSFLLFITCLSATYSVSSETKQLNVQRTVENERKGRIFGIIGFLTGLKAAHPLTSFIPGVNLNGNYRHGSGFLNFGFEHIPPPMIAPSIWYPPLPEGVLYPHLSNTVDLFNGNPNSIDPRPSFADPFTTIEISDRVENTSIAIANVNETSSKSNSTIATKPKILLTDLPVNLNYSDIEDSDLLRNEVIEVPKLSDNEDINIEPNDSLIPADRTVRQTKRKTIKYSRVKNQFARQNDNNDEEPTTDGKDEGDNSEETTTGENETSTTESSTEGTTEPTTVTTNGSTELPTPSPTQEVPNKPPGPWVEPYFYPTPAPSNQLKPTIPSTSYGVPIYSHIGYPPKGHIYNNAYYHHHHNIPYHASSIHSHPSDIELIPITYPGNDIGFQPSIPDRFKNFYDKLNYINY